MHTNRHLAPGFGDLIGGWFVVPQNPVVGGGRAGYVPSLGELLPAQYPVPQNPLMRSLATMGAAGHGTREGMGDLGCGCSGAEPSGQGHSHSGGGCGCGCKGSVSPWSAMRGVSGLSGMGFLGLEDFDVSTVPTWMWAAGGLVLYMIIASPNRADKRADIASAKASYARKRASIQRSYSYRAKVGDTLREQGLLAS